MLHTRKNTLRAAGGGWAHPYGHGPFSPFLYADGGDGGGSGSGGDGGDGGGSGNGDGGGDEDKLGDAGKKALQAERDARTKAENRVKELEAKLTRKPKDTGAKPGEGGDGTGDEGAKPVDAEALKKELREELTAESNARIVRAEVKAAAAGKLADPADAPRYIDLSKIKVGDDGEPDAKQIKKAIEELLKERPYLAGKQPWGDVGGGGHESAPADVEPGLGRLRHAYATESKTK
ncbi:hypothetical protein SFUL_3711 [Streptomyces microflavus DSM 40593]|uniref:Scaffolding protein n=1 Tax=Streptomyces microflavus DSM 40593 TaxID=1303692 RepID=N0CUS4_STRMI|nr:hypothetical protein [Streptomyces microflavus]AGK78629.1 hypothetical protein SFUL_3711 [Streptomyces microflavus DSM 40593]